MKYACFGYYDKIMDGRPKAEIEDLLRRCGPYLEDLYGSGNLVADAGLTNDITCIRTVDGRLSVTDGPFVETKEQLGSVFIIEADDLNDAIRIASKHPTARMGEEFGFRIEIRQIHHFENRAIAK